MEPSLLAAILADPQDDFPRLVLADWLEEAGQLDRAAFIRIQVELARLGDCQRDFSGGLSCCCRFCRGGGIKLRRREGELLDHRPDGILSNHFDWSLPLSVMDTGPRWEFRRGFVAEVSCPTAAWLTHGQALVTCQPLERVTLVDREPSEHPFYSGGTYWRWYAPQDYESPGRFDPDDLPGELWRAYTASGCRWEHPTRREALDCLSIAALTWARDSQSAQCPACGGDGIREVDTGGNVWQSPCQGCAGTGRRGGRAADVSR